MNAIRGGRGLGLLLAALSVCRMGVVDGLGGIGGYKEPPERDPREQPNAGDVLQQASGQASVATVSDRQFVRYPQNDIDGFQHGALMDLRARIALDLLKSEYFHGACAIHVTDRGPFPIESEVSAAIACNLAESLISAFEARGWISPLSTDPRLSEALATQGERMGRFGARQQLGAHAEGREAANVVATPGYPVGPINGGRA